MSQHIVGNMANTIQTDFGEFITISGGLNGVWRVRKNQVLSFCAFDQVNNPDIKGKDKYVLAINVAGAQGIGIPFASLEELNNAAEKLDWIYRKDESRE